MVKKGSAKGGRGIHHLVTAPSYSMRSGRLMKKAWPPELSCQDLTPFLTDPFSNNLFPYCHKSGRPLDVETATWGKRGWVMGLPPPFLENVLKTNQGGQPEANEVGVL